MTKFNNMDELTSTDCYVIDLFPQRVLKDRGSSYFRLEQYYLEPDRLAQLYQRFSNVLLKLNCYFDYLVCYQENNRKWAKNPPPKILVHWVFQCVRRSQGSMSILIESEHAMIYVTGDDLHLSLYHPTGDLLSLVTKIAQSEGLFVWRAGQGNPLCD